MKKLRIATMVTGHFTTPPPEGIVYAPMDIAVAVAQGLAKQGHEISFYAPLGSDIPGVKIVSFDMKPLKQDGEHPILRGPNVGGAEVAKIFNLWDQYLIARMFLTAHEGKYDILHIHPPDRSVPLGISHPDIPVVYTLHDPIYPWRAEIFRMFASPNQYYVSISDAQRRPAPNLNYASTIYNGLDITRFPFSGDKPEGYFIFVGRLHPEKGVAEAVEAARLGNANLKIIGPPVTGDYWDKRIKPFLGEKIQYLGYVPYEKLHKYYQKAKAILVPIQWEEPFGLVMIEAMACGTPVIAFRRGSVPEVVEDGKTGFIVEDVAQMVEAMKKIGSIDRRACRKLVEEKFTVERMVADYEQIFLDIVNKK